MAQRAIPSDVAFSAAVKGEQERRGSRAAYARVEQGNGWPSTVTPDLAQFIVDVRSFYLATASAAGQPYIQHRGGAPGFLRVLDERTLGFADYAGNRQYITLGNLAENPRAFIFMMDYARRLRIKLWGTAEVVENDEAMRAKLSEGLSVPTQRSIVFHLEAWDRNCPQHIPQLIPIEAAQAMANDYDARITALEAEIAELRASR